MMLSRSRVERARRSRRVTTSTSPDSSRRITFASWGLSVFAPETFSLKMLPQPAACSSAICPARSWSRVDTRAYPKVAISLFSFASVFRINKASENSGQENYSQLVSFESSQQLFAERQDGAGPPPADPGGNPRPGAAAPRLISAPLSRESEGPQQSIDQLHNNKALELFVSCTTLSRRAVLRAVPRARTIENPV